MIKITNCKDIATILIDEATKKFSQEYTIDTENLDILMDYCQKLDEICEQIDGESFSVEVLEKEKLIKIILISPDIVINANQHPFYDLVDRTVYFRIYPNDNQDVCAEFVFPSVWRKSK